MEVTFLISPAICKFAASTSSLTISFTFFFTINTKPGDGSISQAASADDVLIATHGKGGSLAENRKLLIEQKLGGGNFRKTGSQWHTPYFNHFLYWWDIYDNKRPFKQTFNYSHFQKKSNVSVFS